MRFVPRNAQEGLLLDFGSQFGPTQIVDGVARIVDKRGGYGRNIRFRNGLLQQVFDWRLGQPPFIPLERLAFARGGEVLRIEEFDRKSGAARVGEWVEPLLAAESRLRTRPA